MARISGSGAPSARRSSMRRISRSARGACFVVAAALVSPVFGIVPAGAHESAVELPPQATSSCVGDVPVVVASDSAAQSDIYSAVTLAGALNSDCVVLAGPRDEPFPADQRMRLEVTSVVGYVVGGEAAVPRSKLEGRQFRRVAGADRWETATAVGECARAISVGHSCGELEFSSEDGSVTLSLDGPYGNCGNRCPRVELAQGVYQVLFEWAEAQSILSFDIRTGAAGPGDAHGLGGCHWWNDTADKQRYGDERITESGSLRLPDFDTTVCQGTIRAGVNGGIGPNATAMLTFTPIALREPVPDAPPAPPTWDWENRCKGASSAGFELDGWGQCFFSASWDANTGHPSPSSCLQEWGSCEHTLDAEEFAQAHGAPTYRVTAVVAGNESCISPDAAWWNAGDCSLATTGLQVVIRSLSDRVCVWGNPYAAQCPQGAAKVPRQCWSQSNRVIVGRFRFEDFDAAMCAAPYDIYVDAALKAKWTITFSLAENDS